MSQIEEVDKLRAEIESLRAGLDEANARMTELRAEHDRETAALVEGHKLQTERLRSGEIARIEQIDRLRKGLAEQLDEEMARTKELERDLRQAQRQLEVVYRSRTWRTGAALGTRPAPEETSSPDGGSTACPRRAEGTFHTNGRRPGIPFGGSTFAFDSPAG